MANIPITVYLGLRDRSFVEESVPYKIESVRVPKERIAMYARGETVGTDDIALVKTKESVVFIPGKVMTVSVLITNVDIAKRRF